MIRIMARISSRPEVAAELQQILQDLVGPSCKESGCISYELYQDEEAPSEFITVELWTDQAAAGAHMATPHVALAVAKAGSLLAQPPIIHRFKRLA